MYASGSSMGDDVFSVNETDFWTVSIILLKCYITCTKFSASVLPHVFVLFRLLFDAMRDHSPIRIAFSAPS
jgi:hypothetical protein